MKRRYLTDLSAAEWGCIEPHAPPPNGRERPKTHTPREILDAIFYVLESGCPWRLLPRNKPFLRRSILRSTPVTNYRVRNVRVPARLFVHTA
jgi:hypothetical protein